MVSVIHWGLLTSGLCLTHRQQGDGKVKGLTHWRRPFSSLLQSDVFSKRKPDFSLLLIDEAIYLTCFELSLPCT